MYNAAVITISDKGYAGQREDTGGPLLVKLLTEAGYTVSYTAMVPDEQPMIEMELIKAAEKKGIWRRSNKK